jgi:pimeloyl-ACP methyl ester carboxylesterase
MPQARTKLGFWHFDDHGAAGASGDPAIVLLHGLLLDRRTWAGQVEALSRIGRVLAFDGPGHGLSEVPPPFTLEEQADALADALAGAEVDRAVVVGQGWGALVALRFALQHPSRAAGLVLSSATADAMPLRHRRAYQALLARVRHFGAPRWLVSARLAPLVYGARALRERPDLASELYRTVNGHPREGLPRAALAVIERSSVASRLGRITAPTLVVWGQRDRMRSLSEAEKLARRIPGARLLRMDCGHTPPVERPALTSSIVLRFARTCLARPTQASPTPTQLSL